MRLAREITQVKTRGIQELTAHRPAKLIGGLALGAPPATAMLLPFAIVNADGPSRPLVTEETVIDPGDDNLAGDACTYDSPFYEDLGAVKGVEAQGPAGDEWLYNSPFYQDFSEVSRIEGRTAALEAQGTPDDAWMYDSLFYDVH